MERILGLAVAGVLTILPLIASAHERHAIRIGDKTYILVVGFLNEPVFVDDKTGLDLRIRLADPDAPLDFSSPDVKPVEKLESSLKVEISAGGKKKLLDLDPVFREPGLYRATFIPTVATTYSYRVFGQLNETPVDLTFTCNAAGVPPSGEDRSEAKLSGDVARIFKSGAFACPRPRNTVEVPERTATAANVAAPLRNWTYITLLIAVIALGTSFTALRKKSQRGV